MTTVLSYGGGRQTVAICVLIARGVLPKPDRIVMADTTRERPGTWAYLAEHVQPMLTPLGLTVEVAKGYSRVGYGHWSKAGQPIVPVYTETGKLSAFCSGEWKRDARNRYLREQGVKGGEMWIGFSLDERRRVKRILASERADGWAIRLPLVELMLTTAGCLEVIRSHGLPVPSISACWDCPNQANAEWAATKVDHPDLFESACVTDEELRAEDLANGGSGVYLHHSRVPLREADLTVVEKPDAARQCGLGMCFV